MVKISRILCNNIQQHMKDVKLFLTDVDGCMTDGGMYYTESGDEFKRFCVYDGMGIVLLRKAGIPCGILTSENTAIGLKRGQKLGLRNFSYLRWLKYLYDC